jgi:hypothetical protein
MTTRTWHAGRLRFMRSVANLRRSFCLSVSLALDTRLQPSFCVGSA